MKLHKGKANGKPTWILDFGERDGARRRKFFSTESDAKKALREAQRDADQIGRAWTAIPAKERANVVKILAEIHAEGLTLLGVWTTYRKDRVAPREIVSLGVAVEETLKSKVAANRRPKYLETLGVFLRQFVRGREATPITAVTPEIVEAWLSVKGTNPWSRATWINRLSTIFSYSVRRGWLMKNPCDQVERVSVEHRPPLILTPRQAARVMIWTQRNQPRWLAWLALALYAGVRPEECDRLAWDNLNLDEGTATVDAAASKVRQRRIVNLHPTAVAWLRIAKELGAELGGPYVSRRRFIRSLRDVLKFGKWPQDILRHTAASYLLAHHQDAGLVARMLGNSAGILLRHYQELVTKKDAERFWGMRPRRHLAARKAPAQDGTRAGGDTA